MKKIKVVFAAILVFVLTFALTACGTNKFSGNYSQQASTAEVQNLSEKIADKAQSTDIHSFEMTVKQTLVSDGITSVLNMKVAAGGTSFADMKMNGSGSIKMSMSGQSISGKYAMYFTDGWIYVEMSMAGQSKKYKQKVFDEDIMQNPGSAMGSEVQTKALIELLEDSSARIYIDNRSDGSTNVKAVYSEYISGVAAEIAAYYVLDAEGNTVAVRITCDASGYGVSIKQDMVLTAKNIRVTVPSGLSDDNEYTTTLQ